MIAKIGGAVIGHGGMGRFHAKRMEENPEVDFIGAYDILPERTESLPGNGKSFPSLDALLADDRIGLVTVATPNDTHKGIVIKALEAGKNVICEKPFTTKLSDAVELAELAKEKRLFLAEAMPTTYLPNYAILKRELEKLMAEQRRLSYA